MTILTPGQDRFAPAALLKKGRHTTVALVLDVSSNSLKVARLFGLPRGMSEGDLLLALERETRLLKTLSHPNLPRFDRVVEGEGGTWLLFDYIDAQPLSAYAGMTVSDAWLIGWLHQLLTALKALHELTPPRVVGYIEPGDVLVAGDRLWLADLGLFEDLAPEVAASQLATLPHLDFVAPERRSSVHTQPANDLFSAAAVSFWLATGRAPQLREDHRAALHQARLELPETVCALIAEALSFYPTVRPPSAEAMLLKLQPFLVDLQGQSPPPVREATAKFVVPDTGSLRAEAARAVQPAARQDESSVLVPDSHEFLEDLLWHCRRHPAAMICVVVMVLLAGVLGLRQVLRREEPPPPAVLRVTAGHLQVQVPHPAVGQGEWMPAQEVPVGRTAAVESGDVSVTFGHGSTLHLGQGTVVTCLDNTAVRLERGKLDVQTTASDQLQVRLPPGNELSVAADSTVHIDATGSSRPPSLDLQLERGTATLGVGSKAVPLPEGHTVRLRPDGTALMP